MGEVFAGFSNPAPILSLMSPRRIPISQQQFKPSLKKMEARRSPETHS
jgi:hypothetical protein